MSSQRIGKYACLEIERRYLLTEIPTNLIENKNGWVITDRYFPTTRLRLRQMQSISGNEKIYKLTQKYRVETQGTHETTITNIYLTENEYDQFKPLEAKIIKKKRYSYQVQKHQFSIDIFEDRHQGLILAEIEFENNLEFEEFAFPAFAFKDVTNDLFFAGGSLAQMTVEEFQQELSQRIDSK